MLNAIKALFSLIRLLFLKTIYRKKLVFSPVVLLSSKAKLRIKGANSKIQLGYKSDLCEGCRLDAVGGIINIGRNVFINRNGIIVSKAEVSIGEYTAIGPNIVIYDHDHDYKNTEYGQYACSPVKIGNHVWIGANCAVLRGVTIGDNVVIAAGSIINKDIPSDSIVIQKRETSVIKKRNME